MTVWWGVQALSVQLKIEYEEMTGFSIGPGDALPSSPVSLDSQMLVQLFRVCYEEKVDLNAER